MFFALLLIFIGLPAVLGMLLGRSRYFFGRQLLKGRRLHAGEPIVYRVVETSTIPAPEAHDIRPAERGDLYYYLINKYWRVEEVLQDGWIVALTPHQEHQYLRRDDPNLRRANLVERLRYATRFPAAA
ncbi:MAG: hypothetical protein ACR2G0_03835 [Chthoniobacterales bacterium]